jgi:hypothetical protein
MAGTPFDSIEGAHEYVRLLGKQVGEVREGIVSDIARAEDEGATRQVDALRLVDYKLGQLQTHLAASSRVLNDLRALRRLLLGRDE